MLNDQLCKETIQEMFMEFMFLFYPEAARPH